MKNLFNIGGSVEKEEKPSDFAFMQLEKRVLDLELEMGKVRKKLDELDSSFFKEMREKLEEFEDVIMAESLVVADLQKSVEDNTKKIENIKKITIEDLERSVLEPFIEQKIEEKISSFLSPLDKIPEIEKKIQILSTRMSTLDTSTKNEIGRLREKIGNLEKEIVEKIVAEVSELKSNVNNELLNMKENLSNTTSKLEVRNKFLSSRLNELKDRLEFLLNRKSETDMRIERLERGLLQLASRIESGMVEGLEKKEVGDLFWKKDELKEFEERIRKVEKKLEEDSKKEKEINAKIEGMLNNIQALQQGMKKIVEKIVEVEKAFSRTQRTHDSDEKISSLLSSVQKLEKKVESLEKKSEERKEIEEIAKALEMSSSKMEELKEQMVTILSKISSLEERIKNLEEKSKEEPKPLVIE